MDHETYPRTLSSWLKKDEKELLKGIKDNADIYELGFTLFREPMSVFHHLIELEDEIGLEIQCDEHYREFLGLVLSGIPVNEAILWSHGAPDRTDDIESLMKIEDMRTAIEFAHDNNIFLPCAESLNDLLWIMIHTEDEVRAATRSVEFNYDVLSPLVVRSHLDGSKIQAESYLPFRIDSPSINTGAKRGYAYKRKSTTKKFSKSNYRKKSYYRNSYTSGANCKARGKSKNATF